MSRIQLIDVLVIGGGVVGLSAAVTMASRGFSVTVLDAGNFDLASKKKNTRVYAINAASQALLTDCGAWELLSDDALSPYQNMHIWDASNQASIQFEARDLARSELGFILEETALRTALLTRAEALDVTCVSSARVSACTETTDGMQVTTEDNQMWHSTLCMIADGANSSMREALNIPVKTWSYHHDALVATVRTEKPHQKTAYQVFSEDGPLAFLPLKNAHQCSIVWSHPPARIKALMAYDAPAFDIALTQAFSEKLGEVELLSPRVSFPLHMRHVAQYSGRAWMLLGDAAHTIHPLAGLGLNVGLADLNTWLRLLDKKNKQNKHQANIKSARMLGAYQRERKHAVWLVIALMQAIKSTFGLSIKPATVVRGLGMRVLNQASPLKQMLMTYATGVDNE